MAAFYNCCVVEKTTSLLQLYFRISTKRGTPVKDLQQIKRYGLKIMKLKLDIKFFKLALILTFAHNSLNSKHQTSGFIGTQKICIM